MQAQRLTITLGGLERYVKSFETANGVFETLFSSCPSLEKFEFEGQIDSRKGCDSLNIGFFWSSKIEGNQHED